MGIKRLKYNRETNIIEVIEEESQVLESIETKAIKQKQRRGTVNFVISILSFMISVGALGISYSQKLINEKQTDVSVRQFELDKKPVFECYIEQKELYNDDDYWIHYKEWLHENEIEDFGQWYYRKFPEKITSSVNEKLFWNAYDNADSEVLSELTNGEFEVYKNEYEQYLSSTNYTRYNIWKKYTYVFKKEYITLKNVGAHITNASLEVYSYINYRINIGNINYSFVIDMRDYVFSEGWLGEYLISQYYDSGSNTFSIEYTQDVQNREEEYLQLRNLSNFLSSADLLDEIGINENDIDVFCIEVCPVYFCITYLDNEQKEQTEWYKYFKESNTLNYIEVYDSDIEVPDYKKVGFTDVYYEAQTLRIAETLGYQNAQWRSFAEYPFEDFPYIEKAKQKIITDLKELVNSMESSQQK